MADGTGLLAISYRGFEGSSGNPSETGFHPDADAAYEFAASQVPNDRIVLWGHSLGTGVAVQLAAERRVKALILELRSQFYFLAHATLAIMGRNQLLSRAYVCTVFSNAQLANI